MKQTNTPRKKIMGLVTDVTDMHRFKGIVLITSSVRLPNVRKYRNDKLGNSNVWDTMPKGGEGGGTLLRSKPFHHDFVLKSLGEKKNKKKNRYRDILSQFRNHTAEKAH